MSAAPGKAASLTGPYLDLTTGVGNGMRGALDGQLVVGFVSGRYDGVVDSEMTPLYGVAGATISRYRARLHRLRSRGVELHVRPRYLVHGGKRREPRHPRRSQAVLLQRRARHPRHARRFSGAGRHACASDDGLYCGGHLAALAEDGRPTRSSHGKRRRPLRRDPGRTARQLARGGGPSIVRTSSRTRPRC